MLAREMMCLCNLGTVPTYVLAMYLQSSSLLTRSDADVAPPVGACVDLRPLVSTWTWRLSPESGDVR